MVTVTKYWIELMDNSQTYTHIVDHSYSHCSMHIMNSISQITSVVVLFTTAINQASSKSRLNFTFYKFLACPRPCNYRNVTFLHDGLIAVLTVAVSMQGVSQPSPFICTVSTLHAVAARRHLTLPLAR